MQDWVVIFGSTWWIGQYFLLRKNSSCLKDIVISKVKASAITKNSSDVYYHFFLVLTTFSEPEVLGTNDQMNNTTFFKLKD
jgi:hypothetical protein